MLEKTFLYLALLSAPAMAATSGFMLGIDYNISAAPDTLQIATDASGNIYTLTAAGDNWLPPDTVTKLAPNGKTVLWQYTPTIAVGSMAVDPNGGVYLIPQASVTRPLANIFVEKLSADGTSVLWQAQLGVPINYLPFLAVDAMGRAFVGGSNDPTGQGYVVRVNAAGVVDYTTTVKDGPLALAVDTSGTYVAVGVYQQTEQAGLAQYGLAWIEPDSATTSYPTIPLPQLSTQAGLELAVAPNGDALVSGADLVGNGLLLRIAPTGAVRFSVTLASGGNLMGIDAASNAFVAGYSGAKMVPVRNNLAPCGSVWLSVFAPDGSLLQATYLPVPANPAQYYINVFIAVAANSTVVVEAGVLLRLSPNSNAQTLPLACVGNAATQTTGPIAPGEIVTLFGSGLGPVQGVAAQATPTSPYPTQVAGVEVTFDGKPAPLLWVQGSQINLQVPWSLTGQTTQVCFAQNNVQANCLTLPVGQAAPGIFTVDGYFALALNADGTVNSAANPAKLGSMVSIFATGLGPIDQTLTDGSLAQSPAPVNELPMVFETLCSGSAACGPTVTYGVAGAGPPLFMIAGVSEIKVPAVGSLNLVVLTYPTTVSSNAFEVYVSQ